MKVNSGLIKWYNRLLDKTADELDEIDISKMIRQDILVDLAIDSAINILKDNPYAGEMYDGDVLNSLNSLVKNERVNIDQLKKLKNIVGEFKGRVSEFEWGDISKRELFIKNIEDILTI
ncbi:TPA: contact-dependent growth inhibition system immunity protein [Salmonella enterica subsp. salamae serovar 21:z10:z6]|nr:contact-dependent growth inhibition system immunity protein [Salmonella enterica]